MLQRLFVVLLLTSALTSAQDFRATLQGNVTDPTNAAITGATVTLRNVDTGVERTETTDNNGYYLFQFVAPGNYALTTKAPGFRTNLREGIPLELSANVRLDVAMALGDAAETISVQADVSVVQTDTSSLGTVIAPAIKDNLPLKGRSSLFMFTLTPGVVNNRYGEDTRPNDTITNIFFSANGAPVAATDVMVDGVINTINVNRGVNISQWVPAVDSVAEFKMETGSLPAEFGRSGGSIMNMIIKSGTNALHGSAYHFLRNSALDANGFFARGAGRPLPAFAANTFGGAIGGPVILPKLYDGRNRTFWFANYEGAREGNGQDRTDTVPTARMRNGDFGEVPAQIYDPFSTTPGPNGTVRMPFPNNVIPLSRQDPVARRIMSFWPNPTRPGTVQNFQFSFKWPRSYDMFVTKIDHQFSTRYNTFFRMNIGRALLIFPQEFEGIATPGRNVVNRPNFGISWGNTVLISPRTTFDVRLGFVRGKERNRPWSDGFDLTSLGFPQQFANLAQSSAFPIIRVAGFQGLAGSAYIEDPGQTWTLQSNVATQRGRHLLKTGIDFRLLYGNFFRNTAPTGQFNFANNWTDGPIAERPTAGTGFPMASFLLGLGSGSIPFNNGLSILNKYYGFFIQDDFRVNSRLTLNLGLRYEYETPRTERFDRTTRGFDPNMASPLQVPGLNLRGGLLFAGQNGLPRGLYNPDRNNFAPRFGFAYSLRRTTILRGGYALHYIPVVGSVEPTGFSTTTAMVTSEDGINPKDRLSNPFPGGLAPIVGNSQGARTLVGQAITFVNPGDVTPKFHTWNFNIQQEVLSRSLVQVGYVGSRGINITSDPQRTVTESLNQLDPRFLSLGASLRDAVPNPFAGILSGPLGGATVARQQLLRPFPQFLDITRLNPAFGNSVYHGLQAKFEQRMWKGMTTLVSYTFSKNITDISPIQNHYDRRAERAVGDFDVPHRLTITGSYDLPIGRGRSLLKNASKPIDLMFGGWNIGVFNTFQSGFPLIFTVAGAPNAPFGAGTLRPLVVGDPTLGAEGDINDRLNRYFNTAAFAVPPAFQFGNLAPRLHSVRSPGMNNVNLTLTKIFSITERWKVHLRASSFNLLNIPVFSAPNTQVNTPNLGRIFTQANFSRQSEVVLRIVF